jgi:hypothetical protein
VKITHDGKELTVTADHIHLGALAHKDFKDGKNPASWVEDEGKWEKAKEAALKTYDVDDDAYWPVVTTIYENMGGEVKKSAKAKRMKKTTYAQKLNELSCARMKKNAALMAGVKSGGYSLEDLRSAICDELGESGFFDSEDGMMKMNPWVTDIIAPAHEQGETWEAIVQGPGAQLYCIQFKIDSDHEVEIVGDPEEVARSTDYEYVDDMETEAKAAIKEQNKVIAADFRGNQHKSASDLADEHSAAANVASREANRASKAAVDKGTHQAAAARHTTAQQMHEVAAEKCKAAGNDEKAEEHEIKAERHERKANDHKGKMEDDQMDKTGAVETKDKKDDKALAAKAEAGHIKLDCASKDSNKLRTILPTEEGVIMYMPAGIHTITPSQAGRPVTVSVLVNEKSAKMIEAQRKTLTANGKKPFFSLQHATEIAAFWPTKFFWDKRIDATGSLVEGVWAEGEWTKSGREAVEGKDFRTFSPTFHVDAVRNDPDNPSVVVDASEYAAANMGALENDPAFQEMSPLWCRNASAKAIKEVHDELKAGGRNPNLSDVAHGVFNKHKILVSDNDVAEAIFASSFGITDKSANPVYYAGQIKAKAMHASHAAFMATAHAYTQDKDGADGDHHKEAAELHAAAQAIHEEGHKAASEAGMDDDTKDHHDMHKDMHGLMAKHHSDMHE